MVQKVFFALVIFLNFLHTQENFDDFLGVGSNPMPPVQQEKNFSLVSGENLTHNNARFAPPSPPGALLSDRLSIMSATAGVLTLWALSEGSWIWGYPPLDAMAFGDAKIWRMLTYANGEVNFKNEKSGLCLSAYGNGVIHLRCNPQSEAQRWQIIFFKNQAVQLKNKASKKCLQTPEFRKRVYYSIFLVDCIKEGESNLDQQWYIIPPLEQTVSVSIIN